MKNFNNILFVVFLLFTSQLFSMEIEQKKSSTNEFIYSVGMRTVAGTAHANEDRFFVCHNDKELSVGLFDGHGGSEVSQFLADEFLSILQQCESLELCLKEAVTHAFHSADFLCLDKNLQGSTALLLIIRGNDLLIAHAGDSRAVLYKFDGQEKSFLATRDHKPNDPDERKRILELGGQINVSGTTFRVGGHVNLTVSRSIGDYPKRHMAKDKGLTCQPEILTRNINSTYKFIILASDGIWDVMTSEDAIHEVKKVLLLASPSRAAKRLISLAQQRGSTDDLTVIVIKFTHLG